MLFAGLGLVCIVKNCDLGLKNQGGFCVGFAEDLQCGLKISCGITGTGVIGVL